MMIVQTRTKYNKWLSDSTKVTMASRDEARARARITGEMEHWDQFRRLMNSCTSLQKKDRQNYLKSTYKKIEEERDSANLFTTTRNLLGWIKAGPPDCFQVAGRAVTKQKEIADVQANYYESKIIKIRSMLPKVNIVSLKYFKRAHGRWIPSGGRPSFFIKSTSVKEVTILVRELRGSHAFGRDELDSSFLKLAAPTIGPIITHIVNLSVSGVKYISTKVKISTNSSLAEIL